MSPTLPPSLDTPTAVVDDESLFARDVDGRLIRVDPLTAADFDKDVSLLIDGRSVTVKKAVPATDAQGNFLKDEHGRVIPRATTIYDAAAQLHGDTPGGNPIPILCHRDHMNPVAVCRLCVVEIAKVKRGKKQTERKLLPACQHRVEETMEVQTAASPNDPAAGERVRAPVKVLIELLMADHPSPCTKQRQTGDCELEALAERFGIGPPRFPRRPPERGRDESSLVIKVDHDACVLCDRCIRGCNDIRDNQVIGRMAKGYQTRIAFDLDQPMGGSSCVACGECSVSCPTGALIHRAVVETDAWKDLTPTPAFVSAVDLYEHPIPEVRWAFKSVSPAFLQWNARSVVRRHFKKGEVICREGAFGSTAFLIEKGAVEVSLDAARQRSVAKARPGSLLGFVGRLFSRGCKSREGPAVGSAGGYDVVSLPPSAGAFDTMGVGALFGEMSCMNHYPRSATVRASEDCTVLEMLRNVLYIMQRSPSFRAVLERNYRDRAINNHLRNVALFAPLREDEARFEELITRLKERVQLRRCEPGEVIIRQGAPANDGFYIVRTGFVKVSQTRPGGSAVLNYIGPNGYFGELDLLSDLPELAHVPRRGIRLATCSALDHVDLVHIGADLFREIIDRLPQHARAPLVARALKILDSRWSANVRPLSDTLDSFLGQGLMNAQSLLVLDLQKCTRCDECTKACADVHDGVTRLIREGLRFDKYLVASSCRSCLDPYCMVGCPVSAIRRRDSCEIVIEDWCIGCGKCAENCPYGNINMHPFPSGETFPDPEDPSRRLAVVQQKATACDLCSSLGPGAGPSCVYACPHDAAHRMSGADLYALVNQATHF